MQNHLPIVDADAHVIETEHTWDYLEPSEKNFAHDCSTPPMTKPGSIG